MDIRKRGYILNRVGKSCLATNHIVHFTYRLLGGHLWFRFALKTQTWILAIHGTFL